MSNVSPEREALLGLAVWGNEQAIQPAGYTFDPSTVGQLDRDLGGSHRLIELRLDTVVNLGYVRGAGSRRVAIFREAEPGEARQTAVTEGEVCNLAVLKRGITHRSDEELGRAVSISRARGLDDTVAPIEVAELLRPRWGDPVTLEATGQSEVYIPLR